MAALVRCDDPDPPLDTGLELPTVREPPAGEDKIRDLGYVPLDFGVPFTEVLVPRVGERRLSRLKLT